MRAVAFLDQDVCQLWSENFRFKNGSMRGRRATPWCGPGSFETFFLRGCLQRVCIRNACLGDATVRGGDRNVLSSFKARETGVFSTLTRVLKIELSRSFFYRSIQAFDGLWNGTGGLMKHLEELERIADGVGLEYGCVQRFDSRPYARASSFGHVFSSTMSLSIFLGENSSDLLQPNAVKGRFRLRR